MFKLTLQRDFTQSREQRSGLEKLKIKALATGRGKWQAVSVRIEDPEYTDESRWRYTATLNFNKEGGSQDPKVLKREWLGIRSAIAKAGAEGAFAVYPWKIIEEKVPKEVQQLIDDAGDEDPVDGQYIQYGDDHVKHALANNTGVTLEDVKERVLPIINDLMAKPDAIRKSPFFKDIFDREPQIRSVLSSIKSFLESNGHRRNHVLLFGLPACAKTQILNAVMDMLGEDAVVRLDGTSTTPAGIYKVYFQELKDIPTPPFAILEEAEKTNEESLRVWLGALDDRGELRKVNAREMASRKVNLLCLATVNDKEEFDKLMGGTVNRPGALSSRFVHHLYCPRPDRKVLEKILKRDVNENGGDLAWVEPAIELAEKLDTDDPRKVLGFLDGGERLLTGKYQDDVLAISGLASNQKVKVKAA